MTQRSIGVIQHISAMKDGISVLTGHRIEGQKLVLVTGGRLKIFLKPYWAAWFVSLEDPRCKIKAWHIHYNQKRHHSVLD